MNCNGKMSKRRYNRFSRNNDTYRDAKFIVIATEGKMTEPLYFEKLALDHRHRRIHVEVLDEQDEQSTASSPKDVIKRLNKFEREYNLGQDDELWLVFDRDKWTEQMLNEVVQQAKRKDYYHVADSNPCFEIWLLLHHKSLAEYDKDTLNDFKQNRRQGTRTKLERELVKICGSYNKSNPDLSHYIPFVTTAIQNAKETDTEPQTRWLNSIGTRVYRLAQSVIDSSSPQPLNN